MNIQYIFSLDTVYRENTHFLALDMYMTSTVIKVTGQYGSIEEEIFQPDGDFKVVSRSITGSELDAFFTWVEEQKEAGGASSSPGFFQFPDVAWWMETYSDTGKVHISTWIPVVIEPVEYLEDEPEE